MKLIVGLGNPGVRYETTRHNAGFYIVDKFARKFNIKFSVWKSQGEVGKGVIFNKDCFLLKPLTYMNLSGRSVAQVVRFYKIPENDIIVIHDDIDVPPGKVRARIGGSDGGHNGILSIIQETGLVNFHRIKLGMGKPLIEGQDVIDWVLGPMTNEEITALDKEMFDAVLDRLKGIFQQSEKKKE